MDVKVPFSNTKILIKNYFIFILFYLIIIKKREKIYSTKFIGGNLSTKEKRKNLFHTASSPPPHQQTPLFIESCTAG
jgi:hypothetical protein